MRALFVLFSVVLLIFLSGCSIGVNACVDDGYCSTRELQSTSICNDCISGPFIPEGIAGLNHYSKPDIEAEYTTVLASQVASGYMGVYDPMYVLYAHNIEDVLDQYAEKTSILLAKNRNEASAKRVLEYLINNRYGHFNWSPTKSKTINYYHATGGNDVLREDLSIFTDGFDVYFIISENNDAHSAIRSRYMDKYATKLVNCNLVDGSCYGEQAGFDILGVEFEPNANQNRHGGIEATLPANVIILLEDNADVERVFVGVNGLKFPVRNLTKVPNGVNGVMSTLGVPIGVWDVNIMIQDNKGNESSQKFRYALEIISPSFPIIEVGSKHNESGS